VIGEGRIAYFLLKNCPNHPVFLCQELRLQGCDSKKEICFSRQSSGTNVSGFKNKMYLPVACFTAILFALEKPGFSLFHINFTLVNVVYNKNF
jgi:hypothetical protein